MFTFLLTICLQELTPIPNSNAKAQYGSGEQARTNVRNGNWQNKISHKIRSTVSAQFHANQKKQLVHL